MDYKRKYRFKSGNRGKENRQFWLMMLIAVAIAAAILYFF
jgi:hypothetical protein